MFSFFRNGVNFIVWASDDISMLRDNILEISKGQELSLEEAFDSSGEDDTIVILTKEMADKVSSENLEKVIIANISSEDLLSRFISQENPPQNTKVRSAPSIIVMRYFGDVEKIISEIEHDYDCREGSFVDLLEQGNDKGVILSFTDRSLKSDVFIRSLYKKALYIKLPYETFMADMRMHALRYINEGIGKKDWYELEIRIYDRYQAYSLQYDRLIEILEELELGLVLGEAWTKDYPRMFMPVGVYRIRFFTFNPPKDIKKVLLGFEYTSDGTRIVDMDLYQGKTKINWTDTLEKELPRIRFKMAEVFRQRSISQMREDVVANINKLDEMILNTRVE